MTGQSLGAGVAKVTVYIYWNARRPLVPAAHRPQQDGLEFARGVRAGTWGTPC